MLKNNGHIQFDSFDVLLPRWDRETSQQLVSYAYFNPKE